MSYFGYPDLDRPIRFENGTIYYPFGGGPFSLTPHRCSIATGNDGHASFALDLIRSIVPLEGYALLEMRMDADYAGDQALSYLRSSHPQAVLTEGVLTEWEFRLAQGPATLNVPEELLRPIRLASNNLGSARMVLELSLEAGLIIERMLEDSEVLVQAVAEAEMRGVSPRVSAVVRFRVSELLEALGEVTDINYILTWQSLVNFFNRDLDELPLEINGSFDRSRALAFAETMADRVITHFGSYVTSANENPEPLVRLQMPEHRGITTLLWSLSQPLMVSRRLIMSFDLLTDVRHQVDYLGIDVFVRRHTANALPSLGRSSVRVLCNLPVERVGVVALGVNLTFPPQTPHRPQTKSTTVLFEPPEDMVIVPIQLSPDEPLEFTYSTFAVISDECGLREVYGPTTAHVGSTLRLSPEHFPLEFILVETSAALASLAVISGDCRYERDGKEYSIPFGLDSGRLAISLALPQGSKSARIICEATARDTDQKLCVGPFEPRHIRLDLFSFPQYGGHEVEFECEFDGITPVYAIEVLPAGVADSFENSTILAFTPAQTKRSYRWFARSPFRSGFFYRPHQTNGSQGVWRHVSSPIEHLLISPERPPTGGIGEIVALSSKVTYKRATVRAQQVRESEGVEENFPISPQEEPTDLLLYAHPADLVRKLYLPRYSLDVQTVSGQHQYRISMAQQGQGATFKLTIHLVKGPAESLGEAAKNADEYPHEIAITLDFLQFPPSGARKTLPFQSVTVNGNIVTASLTFVNLQERDEVFRALTESARQTRLIVTRIFGVAIPQFSSPKINKLFLNINASLLPLRPYPSRPLLNSETGGLATVLPVSNVMTLSSPNMQLNNNKLVGTAPVILGRNLFEPSRLMAVNRKGLSIVHNNVLNISLPKPNLTFIGKKTETLRGRSFIRVRLSVSNWEIFSGDFFQSAPDLPPCGNNKASRTWVDIYNAETDSRLQGFCQFSSPNDLTKLWFGTETGKVPKRVYVRMEDRRTRLVRKSNEVETWSSEPLEPVYRQVIHELEYQVQPDPFTFPAALHGYMFQGIVPGNEIDGLITFRVRWNDRYYTYLQDATRPNLVYYFPDHFKIARRREAPFTPYITVRVVSQSGLADTEVVFDYIVAPYTMPQRLRAARDALLADPKFSASDIQFQPFSTSDVRFFVDRPTERGSVREERSGASLVLQGALKDTLVMKLPDFGRLFDAMHRDTASLFMGRVEIEVPSENTEVIPFTARFEDLAGELFLYATTANSDGSINISLQNAIESPIRINVLDCMLHRGGNTVEVSILDPTLPVESLGPGSVVEFKVVPQNSLLGSGTTQVEFSLEHVVVMPNPDAIWDTILDRSTVEYFDTITVKAIANLFQPIPGRESEQIVAILIDFEGGGSGELNAGQLEAEVRIDYPIDDVILRRNINTTYRYTVTVIRANGNQEQDAEPRQQSARTFFVSVQR